MRLLPLVPSVACWGGAALEDHDTDIFRAAAAGQEVPIQDLPHPQLIRPPQPIVSTLIWCVLTWLLCLCKAGESNCRKLEAKER